MYPESPYDFALANARAAAQARRLRSVCDAINAGRERPAVSYSWAEKFSRGLIPNAGHRRVELFASHFRANPVALADAKTGSSCAGNLG